MRINIRFENQLVVSAPDAEAELHHIACALYRIARALDTAEVQRLRRVRQLGVTCIAFHGAEHTRFSHAVGAAHVMKRLLGGLGSSAGDVAAADRLTPDRVDRATDPIAPPAPARIEAVDWSGAIRT